MKKAFKLFSAALSKVFNDFVPFSHQVHQTSFTLALLCAVAMMAGCKGGDNTRNTEDTVCTTDTIPLSDTAFVELAVEVTQNGMVWEDVRISQAEFEAASRVREQYQLKRIERKPNEKDSAIVRKYAEGTDFGFDEFMEESGFYRFEGAGDIVELAMGDYCATRTLDDTTIIPTCGMCLSHDNLLAGLWSDAIYYNAYEEGATGMIYIYPYNYAYGELGKPYIYKTHPRWYPGGDQFWGADGWFFITGRDPGMNPEYHKVRPKKKK